MKIFIEISFSVGTKIIPSRNYTAAIFNAKNWIFFNSLDFLIFFLISLFFPKYFHAGTGIDISYCLEIVIVITFTLFLLTNKWYFLNFLEQQRKSVIEDYPDNLRLVLLCKRNSTREKRPQCLILSKPLNSLISFYEVILLFSKIIVKYFFEDTLGLQKKGGHGTFKIQFRMDFQTRICGRKHIVIVSCSSHFHLWA